MEVPMRNNKIIRAVGISLLTVLWLFIAIWAWFIPSKNISFSERRPLAQFPDINAESILSGEFIEEFEEYTVDQFPARDTLRQIKSMFHYYIIQQKDNNDIYIEDGYAAKLEYPLNEKSLDNANKYFNKIYQKYIKDANTSNYIAIIPDKNYYLGTENNYLTMDYEKMFKDIKENNSWAEYIDITEYLSIEDYYRTDTHWKQENIMDVAGILCDAMGVEQPNADHFTTTKIDKDFYGVYYGQAALPMKPDDMYIMNNKNIDKCIVTDFETGRKMKIYEKSMINSQDLYDIYLGGAKALITIENPNASTNKELIIFRDSFGSSITPLLIQSYSKITLIDIRYVSVDYIDKFVVFDHQDVLFLYSTLVLNSSFAFK